MVVISENNKAFAALRRPDVNAKFSIDHDILAYNDKHFRIDGKGIDTSLTLTALPAFQEFWHSWRTFNPGTKKY